MPTTTAPSAVTKPQAGVMTTRPATAPEQNPRTLGLPRVRYSAMAQTKEATAVARVVVIKALAATTSAATALPALKPYHPTHNIPVPTMHSTKLCGGIGSLPKPNRLPRIKQRTKADHPEDMWTTVPPAKSIAWMGALALPTPLIMPSIPQTMCAKGKYTMSIQSVTNTRIAENFIRSAMAPTISAGVMMANIIWYIA